MISSSLELGNMLKIKELEFGLSLIGYDVTVTVLNMVYPVSSV